MENSFKFQKGDIIARDPLNPVEGNIIIKFSAMTALRDHLFKKGCEKPDAGYLESHTLICNLIDEYLHSCREQIDKGVPAENDYQGHYRCINCGHELSWQSDFSYDDIHGEGDEGVSYWHRPHCGAMHEVSVRTDNEEEE